MGTEKKTTKKHSEIENPLHLNSFPVTVNPFSAPKATLFVFAHSPFFNNREAPISTYMRVFIMNNSWVIVEEIEA